MHLLYLRSEAVSILSFRAECLLPGILSRRRRTSASEKSPMFLDRFADEETGTGFADAELSEILRRLALLAASG
jgi:hypothetical protein